MAEIRIILIPEHRDSLLACVPGGSKLSAVLRDARETRSSSTFFDDNYEIHCDQHDAYVLLNAAKKSCPGAVERIEDGLSQRRQKGS
jgi:hypothetical protein